MPLPDWAPVLMAPNIFEPTLCERLVAHHKETGGEASGFMREIGGKTTLVTDPHHKMRRDREASDESLCGVLRHRILTRLVPMVKRAFQFEATRMERYLVGSYQAGAGHFRPHRDNTTKGTAHRRFAVTINLNAGDYEGGDLRFPEFGGRAYRAPTGGAIVFSCSLLHEATPVTRGTRYAFLPFLYDDAAARLREENNPHLDERIGTYKAGT
jgi:predicted 2-oxoglutarate/Fe(II)-dependent dioxygenase YbiX